MTTQLQAFVTDNGRTFTVNNRDYSVEGVSVDGDIAVGTFTTTRSSHTGVLCNKSTVIGKPGAEVWSVISNRGKEVARFAIYQGAIVTLSR